MSRDVLTTVLLAVGLAPLARGQVAGKCASDPCRDPCAALPAVLEEARKAVVFIEAERPTEPCSPRPPRVPPLLDDTIFDALGPLGTWRWPGLLKLAPRAFEPCGEASGFIVAPDGLVLTNHHPLREGERFHVTLSDGRRFAARLVGADPQADVAVLRFDAEHGDLPTLPLRDSDTLRLGERVLALGNPFGGEQTVSLGVVSAARRRVGAQLEDYVQTDAAIHPGNTGGPLIDAAGRVVGVATAISTHSGTPQVGFAVPINLAQQIAAQLTAGADEPAGPLGERFDLGLKVAPLTADAARRWGHPTGEGVLVSDVEQGSPADLAGIRRGQVILRLGSTPLSSPEDYEEALEAAREHARVFLLVRSARGTRCVVLGGQQS